MFIKKITVLLTLSLLFVSCATNSKPEINPFDALTLKNKLHKGKTTQKDVVNTFGAPNITTISTDTSDVWVYSRSSSDTKGSGFGTGLLAFLPLPIPVIGDVNFSSDKSSHRSRTVTLTIEFRKDKVVKDYTLTKTQF